MAVDFKCGGAVTLVHAEVTGIQFQQLSDGFPITWYQLSVVEEIGATSHSASQLMMPGGELAGGGRMLVPHYPRLIVGDKIIASVVSADVYGTGRVRLRDAHASLYLQNSGATDGLYRPWWVVPDGGSAGQDTSDTGRDFDDGVPGPATEVPPVERGLTAGELKNAVSCSCQDPDVPYPGINYTVASVVQQLAMTSGVTATSSPLPMVGLFALGDEQGGEEGETVELRGLEIEVDRGDCVPLEKLANWSVVLHSSGTSRTNNVRVDWELSPDDDCDGSDHIVIGTNGGISLGVLSPFKVQRDSMCVPPPATTLSPGMYRVCARVDPDDIHAEFQEDDNVVMYDLEFEIGL